LKLTLKIIVLKTDKFINIFSVILRGYE